MTFPKFLFKLANYEFPDHALKLTFGDHLDSDLVVVYGFVGYF